MNNANGCEFYGIKFTPEDLASMTPAERRELDQLRPADDADEADALAVDLPAFVKAAWPLLEPTRPLVWGRHLDAICEHLEAVSAGQIQNLLIEIPPGSGKSTLTSVLWPVWDWITTPGRRFLTASYALNLAIRDALRSRRVLQAPWYRARWGEHFDLCGDQNVKSRYENDRTGYRIALSVGSSSTGERGDITVIDDPHNVIDAESVAIRLSTILWHDEAFWNRINDEAKGGRVVIGQRVHTQDLIGHCKEAGEWVSLRIPEEFEAKDRCVTVALWDGAAAWQDWRREEGELMRPDRLDARAVAGLKKRLGTVAYAAQYQQHPVPREGALFRADWLNHRFVDTGDSYQVGERTFAYSACWHMTIVDPAGGLSESADFTAIGTFAVTPLRDLLVVSMVRERIPVQDIGARVKRQATLNGRRSLFVGWESAFLQGQYAKEAAKLSGMPPIRAIDPGGKVKFVRAIPAIVLAEAGNLWFPKAAEWLGDCLAELLVFTGQNDAHDDQVDAIGMAVSQREVNAYADARPIAIPR